MIIGHMGSGKSHIGKKLAKILNWNYFDSDREIEKNEKKTILEIFQMYGEKYFRKKEELIINSLINKRYCIISLGGGSVTIQKIRNMIKKKCISIFLKVDIELLIERLKRSKNRPLLVNTNIRKKIISLDKERLKYYNSADIIIQNTGYYKKTINQIIKILNK